MKVQVHISLEPPLKYNKDQTPLTNQGVSDHFKPTWELHEYYTVSDWLYEGKQVKKYPSHQDQSSSEVFAISKSQIL